VPAVEIDTLIVAFSREAESGNVDQFMNTHVSESLVVYVAEQCGIETDLGVFTHEPSI